MKENKVIRDPEAIQLLADDTRMKMVYLLRAKELTVSQIAAELGLTTQTIYHHVKRLKECDMIEVAREERIDHLVESYYRATAGTFYFVNGRCADERRDEKAVERALVTLGALGYEIEAEAPLVKSVSKQMEMLWRHREDPSIMTKIFEMDDFNPFVQRQVVEFAMLMAMTNKDFEKYMDAQRRLRSMLLSARNERS
ncbi:MAG: winged helix-turn-helix transcriptional regulator [Methanobacteriota archaeon]|nr:MAG: winged helix-turn-helix transcriptional regulator [Euryarchaeota archaeon]